MDVADNFRLMFYAADEYRLENYRRVANAATAARNAGLDLAATKDVVRLGKALDVNLVVTGSVKSVDGVYTVNVELTDVRAGTSFGGNNAEGLDLRLIVENLVKDLSGAERFGVLFPDDVKVLAPAEEKEIRWAISLVASEQEVAIYDVLSPRGKSMMLDKFWLRRDPDPNTPENEYQLEFTKRVEYAQENFTTPLKEGIRSDRGRVYVLFGPPDEVEDESAGKGSISGFSDSTWSSKPYFAWKYHGRKDAGGKQMLFVFVDEHGDGEYLIFASTQPGFGKRLGGYAEYDADRLQKDEGDTMESAEGAYWDPGTGGKTGKMPR
jgi:GWxTD domain-containing protein